MTQQSTLPRAHIVHQLRGRLRLRIREKRLDSDYFQEVSARIESLDGVTEVSCNATTGSLLLLHPELPFVDLEPRLNDLSLFEMVTEPEITATPLEKVSNGFSWLNQAISETSSGDLDLRSLAFLGLIALSIQQIMRGNIMGPAIPMLFNAMSLVQQTDSSDADSVS